MNSFLADFLTGLENRFNEDTSDTTMSAWIVANTHLKKKPFSFKGYEFQRQIVDDMHPDLCVIKPSQVGLTEIQIRKFLAFLKRNGGTTGIFTLPNDKMMARISQTRIKPLIESEDVFNQHDPTSKPIRHKGLYQVEQSFGYVTGSTEGDATSIAADFLFHDETDLTDQEMLGLFQSRLQGSKVRITQNFSTPTLIGFGIDAKFNVSDQHEYMYRCPSCRHYQVPKFKPQFLCLPGNKVDDEDLSTLDADQIAKIDLTASYVRCQKCSTRVTHDPAFWEWVATYPSRKARGYRIPSLAVRTIDVPYIFGQLEKYRAMSNIKGFHNTVLGEPYNDSNARLQEAQIRSLFQGQQAHEPNPDEGYFIGIDVGITCHIVVGTPGLLVHFEQTPQNILVERVKQLLAKFNIIAGCIDLEPYRPTAEEIRDLSEGRILPVDYSTTNRAPAISVKLDEFENLSHIVVNRTTTLDNVAQMIRKQALYMSGYGHLEHIIIQHLMDMVRIEKPDEDARWEKVTSQDHFFHAIGYMLVAMRNKMLLDFSSDAETRFNVLLSPSRLINFPQNLRG